jgi:hypothetical protein
LPIENQRLRSNLYKHPNLNFIMPKGHKREGNIVKIQVEAKQPRRKKRTTTTKHVATLPKGLLQNFVALQKVQANLAEKLDALAKQISELLNLFEATAKSFSENPAVLTSERDKEFIDKINQLLEQDKVIAKGVVYIEDRVNEIEKAVVRAPQPEPYMPAPEVPMAPTGEMAGEYRASSPQSPKPLPRV